MRNRINETIDRLGKGKMLVPFFTAGFPDRRTFHDLVSVACDCGCDLIEIGVPFSDPLADGPEIQFSSQAALKHSVNLSGILSGVEKIRHGTDLPLILMGYYNPIIAYGEGRFFSDAGTAGVDGLIIPDLPVEEASTFQKSAAQSELSTIFLVAPTSSDERIRLIDRRSSAFVYAVTVTGVTGTGKDFSRATDTYLRKLGRMLDHKFVAGFGVSSAVDAQRLVRYSDGVVIGSALVKIIRSQKNRSAVCGAVSKFLKTVRKAIG